MRKSALIAVVMTIVGSHLWAHVDVRMGASANFSVLDFSRIGQATAELNQSNTARKIEYLNRVVNTAQAGVQYNLYVQTGWAWEIFQAGGELSFGFNAFSDANHRHDWSSVMGFSTRAYFGFDLFLARVTLLVGNTFNFQAGQVVLLKDYNRTKVDLGFRLGVGPLMAEFIGVINTSDPALSLFKVGVGLEFVILGG